jgi:two-component system sensor histidine kinase KdpD
MKWLWGLLIPAVLTAMDWLFRGVLTPSNFLMIYLLGVFFVAIRFGLWPSVVGALTSVAVFAFFFAPPIFSFAIADPENLFGVSVMLVVATVTSKLAETMRTQTQVAEHRAHRASALYRLSKELAEARLASDIITIGMQHIQLEFGGRNAFIFPSQQGELAYPVNSANVWLDKGFAIAQWVFNNAQMAGRGTTRFSADPALYLPLKSPAGTLGVLALEVVDFHKVFATEQFQLLDTFVNQVIHSLERANLAEKAKEATLKMQSEALRNSLLSSISHDLRTPLATIIGAASTLETDLDLNEASKQKLVGAISEEAQRMSDLMAKILDMARLEAGEVVLNRQWHSPEEMVGSALRRLDKKLKSRQVKVTMADSFALVHVDAVLLQQVLVNLLDNAAKYSPPGSPIDITVETHGQGLSISVANTGEGIPKALQQKVFDKFFRICPESAQSGVGLGLSICRAIVGAHGGDIQAATDQGRTVFQLHLPFLEAPPTIALEEKEPLP